MGIQDTAESLLGKSKRRRERHDLQKLGVKLGAEWISNRNEELDQKNERFHNSDETLWQQQINQEDAITDSQWFLNERVTGRENARGLLGHIEELATTAKTNQINTALGTQGAKLYHVEAAARDLAKKDAPELLKLFEAGYHHAETTDWDMAKFEDFLAIQDGKPDNVLGEAWQIMTSPFRDQSDDVTARELADIIGNSEFGKNATAMITYRKALREGFSISTATDLGEVMRDYKIKNRLTKEDPHEVPEGLANANLGNSRLATYTTPLGDTVTRPEFGDYLNIAQIRDLAARYATPKLESGLDNPRFDEEASNNLITLADQMEAEGDSRYWFPNETSQAAYDANQIFGFSKTETTDAAGQDIEIYSRAIYSQEGHLIDTITHHPDNYRAYKGGEQTSLGQFAAAATPQQMSVAIDDLMQSLNGLMTVGMEGIAAGENDITIQKFLDKALGVAVAGQDEGVTAVSADRAYNRLGSRIFGIKESLRLSYGISEEVASNLATSLMSQSLLSGLELNDNGTYDYDTAFGSPGGLNYNFNTPINFNNGITAFDLIHAYASTESSGRDTYFIPEDLLFKVMFGSIGMDESTPEQREQLINRQQEQGSYVPGLAETKYNGTENRLISYMDNMYKSNNKYAEAINTIADYLEIPVEMFLTPMTEEQQRRFERSRVPSTDEDEEVASEVPEIVLEGEEDEEPPEEIVVDPETTGDMINNLKQMRNIILSDPFGGAQNTQIRKVAREINREMTKLQTQQFKDIPNRVRQSLSTAWNVMKEYHERYKKGQETTDPMMLELLESWEEYKSAQLPK